MNATARRLLYIGVALFAFGAVCFFIEPHVTRYVADNMQETNIYVASFLSRFLYFIGQCCAATIGSVLIAAAIVVKVLDDAGA